MADGIQLTERVESALCETTNGIAAFLAVAAGATAGGIVIGTAAKGNVGVTTEAVTATNAPVNIQSRGIAKVRAAGVIPRLTSNSRTQVVAAASGLVQTLPGTPGTYYRVGWMHHTSAPAATSGDIVSVELDPGVVVVPTSGYVELAELAKGPLANVSAGATSTVFIAKVPTGRAFTLTQVQGYNGTIGAAGGTLDVLVDGVTVLSAPVALTSSTVTAISSFVTPLVAAGSVITLAWVGGAATGTIAAPEATVFYNDAAA